MKSIPSAIRTFFYHQVKYKASIWDYDNLTVSEIFDNDVPKDSLLVVLHSGEEDITFHLSKPGKTKSWLSNSAAVDSELVNIVGTLIDHPE